MQTNQQFFAQRLKGEIPAFVKVLRALPADKLDYRPHEKNTAAGALAWQVVSEMTSLIGLFDSGTINYGGYGDAPSPDDMAAKLEEAANTLVERAPSVPDDKWNGPGKFLWMGTPVWEATVSELAWGFLFDLVHHRGQLSAYLRPMGGKVPAIYGPSGDEQS